MSGIIDDLSKSVALYKFSSWIDTWQHDEWYMWGRKLFPCVFKDLEVTECFNSLQDRFVPSDKAPNNFGFVCEDYYYQCLVNELGSTNTYLARALVKEEILRNHIYLLFYHLVSNIDEHNQDLPELYWIPKLEKFLTKIYCCISQMLDERTFSAPHNLADSS